MGMIMRIHKFYLGRVSKKMTLKLIIIIFARNRCKRG